MIGGDAFWVYRPTERQDRDFKIQTMNSTRNSKDRVYSKKRLRLIFVIATIITICWSVISNYRQQQQWLHEGNCTVVSYDGIYISIISIISIMFVMYWMVIMQTKYLYDLEKIYTSMDPKAPSKALDAMAEMICQDTLLNTKRSVAKKCRRLVNINQYTIQLEPQEHNYIHVMSLYKAFYALGEYLDRSPLIEEQREELMNLFASDSLKDLSPYYGSVLGLVDGIARNGNACEVSSQLLSKFCLPSIRR